MSCLKGGLDYCRCMDNNDYELSSKIINYRLETDTFEELVVWLESQPCIISVIKHNSLLKSLPMKLSYIIYFVSGEHKVLLINEKEKTFINYITYKE